jgi:hypothetical protein
MRTQDRLPFHPSRPLRSHVDSGQFGEGFAVAPTSVPPSQGGNELKGVVVSGYANYAPCPVTPRLMQEIEEQNQLVSLAVRSAPPAISDEKREIRVNDPPVQALHIAPSAQ